MDFTFALEGSPTIKVEQETYGLNLTVPCPDGRTAQVYVDLFPLDSEYPKLPHLYLYAEGKDEPVLKIELDPDQPRVEYPS